MPWAALFLLAGILSLLVAKELFVLSLFKINVRCLLAMVLLICTGCAGQLCRLPDDCAVALSRATIGWRLRDFCEDCPLEKSLYHQGEAIGCDVGGCVSGGYVSEGYVAGDSIPSEGCETETCDGGCDTDGSLHVYEDEVWLDGPRPARRPPIKAGPRPVSYEPPMPPQFLLVPTSSQQCAF